MISIIITAYKEEKTIGRAIEAFIKQRILDKYEVLVVAPDKETIDAVKKYKNVKLIKDPQKGKPYALNLAFEKAKGNIFILSDGDVFVSENSVEELLKPFKDKNVGAISGRPISISPKNTMLGYWSHLLTDQGAHLTRLEKVKAGKFIVCSGYLFAFRKGIFKKIPEEALSEDAVMSHFIWQKGYKIDYAPKAEVYVKYPTTFKDWLIQKRRSTGGYQQIELYVKDRTRMRSFSREAFEIKKALVYPKNLREFIWTTALVFARLYLWLKIYIDLNMRKKKLKEVWQRVETTK